MKYVVLIGDGMADRPLEELGGLTLLQKARTPNMDRLASEGDAGMVRTIPKGFHPGSDVANLSILGYAPADYYSGRAPLEAASIGVELGDDDVAYRCNLVTLKNAGDDAGTLMEDYSSGHITTPEAAELISSVGKELGTEALRFYPGVSYRHLLVWTKGNPKMDCTPPHDILGRDISGYLPKGEKAEILLDLMKRSEGVLRPHPVNVSRKAAGKRTADSVWFWGQGGRPKMPDYMTKYGLTGALISAVDLTKGLGIYAGFEVLDVPGATGWIDTNYAGKVEYALRALKKADFVYIHIEAPDEAGHSGNYKDKLKAIEDFDALVVGPVLKGLEAEFGDHLVLLMPDHATPVAIRTHSEEPVPFVIYDSRNRKSGRQTAYDESIAERADLPIFEEGHRLMDYFIGRK